MKPYFIVSAIVGILLYAIVPSTYAASYELLAQQDFGGQDVTSPTGIRARVTVLPNGKIQPGNNVRFVIRIYNDNSSAAGNINISFIPDQKVAELVAAKPELDFASDFYSTWETVGWKNITIPAKKSKDFSVTYRVSPTQAFGSTLKFTAWVGQGDYQIDRAFTVDIATSKGNQAPVHTNGFDNFFRVATGHFPSAAERAAWLKRYEEYRTSKALGAYGEDRIASFMKEVRKKLGATVAPSTNSNSSAKVVVKDIPALFKGVFGRLPSASERKYWEGRLKDKTTKDALVGAMTFQKAKNAGRVLGVSANTVYRIELKDGTSMSAPGELVAYSAKITNIYTENKALTPGLTITAKGLEIPSVSDHGKRGKLTSGKLGGTIDWNYLNSSGKNPYEVTIDTKKSYTFTFTVKSPTELGKEYCVEAYVFPFLQTKDCNTVGKSAKKAAPVTKTVSKPTPAVASKDFALAGPNGLNTDPNDQNIAWRVTDKVKALYPKVKIELCPGKDFKNCIVLDAVAENDGSQLISMPPVPRTGKWYLHLIARNSDNGLMPSVQSSRLVTLHQ